MRDLAGELGIEDQSALATIQDYDGAVNYVENYRNKLGIGGEDKGHWIHRMLSSLDEVNTQGQAFMARLARAGDFCQRVMDAAKDQAKSRSELQALLDETLRNTGQRT